jgi:hypothetical protein
MNSFRLEMKVGSLLYLGIFVSALLLRVVNLGAFPLTDDESLSALVAAHGTTYETSFLIDSSNAVPQPSYEFLTRIAFQLFGADDFIARIIPALAGSLLVLTPLLARKKIGWVHAVLMGFLLGFLPVFVATSRTASGVSLTVLGLMSFSMAIIGLGEDNRSANEFIAAVGLALALTSGPYVFTAALSFGLVLIIWQIFRFPPLVEIRNNLLAIKNNPRFGWIILAAAVVFATGLGWSLNGLSNFFNSIAFWFMSWTLRGPFASLTIVIIILTYMPVLTLLGFLGGWSTFRNRDRTGLFAFGLTIIGLLIILIHPGRQPHDLLWIALPLSYVGSAYLASFAHHFSQGRVTAWVFVMGFSLILLAVMAYLQISSIAGQDQIIDPLMAWMTPLVFLTIVLVALSFFGLGWDWASARLSLILAALLLVFLTSISTLWNINFNSRVLTAKELWRNKVPSAGQELLVETLEATSQSTTGTRAGLHIDILSDAPYSLIWALRDFQPPENLPGRDAEGPPVVLVSKEDNEPVLIADYVGQTIAIGEEWGWRSALPPEFLRWWIKRQPPRSFDEWLILIRQDIAFFESK